MDFREVRGRLIQLDLWSSSFETLPGVVDKFVQEYRRKVDNLIIDDNENEWKNFQEVQQRMRDQGYTTSSSLITLCLWLDAPLGPDVKVFTTLCDLWFHLTPCRKKEVGAMLGGLAETKWVAEVEEKAHRAKTGFVERGPLPEPLQLLLDQVFRDMSAFVTLLKTESAAWLHYERYQGSFRWGAWFRDEWHWKNLYANNRLWISAQGRWRDVRGPRWITPVLVEQSNLQPYVALSSMETLGFDSVFPNRSSLPLPTDLTSRRKDLHLFTNHQRRELLSKALTQVAMRDFFELFVDRRLPTQTGVQQQRAAIDKLIQQSKAVQDTRNDIYDLGEHIKPLCSPRFYVHQITEVLVHWIQDEQKKEAPEGRGDRRDASWTELRLKVFREYLDLKTRLETRDASELKKYNDKRARMSAEEKKQHRVSPSDLPIHPAILERYFLQFLLEDLKVSFWETILPAVVSAAEALGQLKSQLLSTEVSDHPSSTNLFQLVRVLEDDYHTFLASVDRRSDEAQPYTLLPRELFEKLKERRAEQANLLILNAMAEQDAEFKKIAYEHVDHKKASATLFEETVARVQKIDEGARFREWEEKKERQWLKTQLGDIANMTSVTREKILRTIEPTRDFFAYVFGELDRLREDTKVLGEKLASAIDRRQDPRIDEYEQLKRNATIPRIPPSEDPEHPNPDAGKLDTKDLTEALWTTPLDLATKSDYENGIDGLVRLASASAHDLRGILKKVRVLVQSDRTNSNVYAVNLHPKLKELAAHPIDPPPERKSERKSDEAVRAFDDPPRFQSERNLVDITHALRLAPDLDTRLKGLFALFTELVQLKMLYNTCLVV